MTTIINTPSGGEHHDSDGGMGVGMILGIIVTILVVIVLFYMYGWPAIRGTYQPSPAPPAGDTYNITVPNPLDSDPTPAPAPAN